MLRTSQGSIAMLVTISLAFLTLKLESRKWLLMTYDLTFNDIPGTNEWLYSLFYVNVVMVTISLSGRALPYQFLLCDSCKFPFRIKVYLLQSTPHTSSSLTL